MKPEFWQDRSVFVTGHTGFKGGWLCLWLRQLGANVTGYALAPPDGPGLFAAANVADGIRSVFADVRDEDRLILEMVAARPEVVFHLAAQPIVKTSYKDPVETYGTNVMGTCHVLEAVRLCRTVRSVVVVTSDKCYEDPGEGRRHREEDAMGGSDPYSSSKGCAELLATAYRRSYFSLARERPDVALATARAGNVIGGGDWGDFRLVPDIVGNLAEGKKAVVDMPTAVRPWQHVVNPLSGYLLLGERLHDAPAAATGGVSAGQQYAEAWNFGPLEEEGFWTTLELADGINRRWRNGAGITTGTPPDLPETKALRLDSGKAGDRLGWRPPVDLRTALEWLVEWYSAYYSDGGRAGLEALTLAQIAEAQLLLLGKNEG